MATQNRLKKESNTLRKRIFNLEVRVKSDEEKTKAQDVQVNNGFGDDKKPRKNDASKEVDILDGEEPQSILMMEAKPKRKNKNRKRKKKDQRDEDEVFLDELIKKQKEEQKTTAPSLKTDSKGRQVFDSMKWTDQEMEDLFGE